GRLAGGSRPGRGRGCGLAVAGRVAAGGRRHGVGAAACSTAAGTDAAATAALAAVVDGVEAVVGDRGFLDVRGADGTQVVGGLETAPPGQLVQLVDLAAGRFGHVQVQALRLVQPLLPPRGGFHQPARVDLEGALVQHLEVVRDAVDGLHAAVVV